MAVICVLLFTVNELAGVPLKLTAVAPVKPSPAMVTVREASHKKSGEKPVTKRLKVAMAPAHCERVIEAAVYAVPELATFLSRAKAFALLPVVAFVVTALPIVVNEF